MWTSAQRGIALDLKNSIAETQPQLQPDLLSLSAMISQSFIGPATSY
jgi:hypothetical protein